MLQNKIIPSFSSFLALEKQAVKKKKNSFSLQCNETLHNKIPQWLQKDKGSDEL